MLKIQQQHERKKTVIKTRFHLFDVNKFSSFHFAFAFYIRFMYAILSLDCRSRQQNLHNSFADDIIFKPGNFFWSNYSLDKQMN